MQGSAGIYRDSLLGTERVVDHATLKAPRSWLDCDIDEHGMSRWVWVRPLPAARALAQPVESEAA
jgi:hypothetical protein